MWYIGAHLDGANVADVLDVLVDRRLQRHVLSAHRKALPVLRLIAAEHIQYNLPERSANVKGR